MGGSTISSGGKYCDLRLALERIEDRTVATLSQFGDAGGSLMARYEASPDWSAIEAGLDILQHPERHPGESIQKLGLELGRAVLGPPILGSLLHHLQARPVRLWLRPDRELAHLPWEACAVDEGDGFGEVLSLHPGLSLIRDIGSAPMAPKMKSGQTQVLLVWADPDTDLYRRLPGIEKEVRSVVRALATPECRHFSVDEVKFATISALQRSIRAKRPDILHFIGHGDVLPTGGVLVFESGEANVGAMLHGDELAPMLRDAGVELVLLSGCMTGEAGCGVGTELATRGVPAVVAMQAPMHDGSAGLFARAFYGSLGIGESVDDAVAEGRIAVRGSANDWAVPVVMRAPFDGPRFDGAIDFDLIPEAPAPLHNLTYDERPFIGRHAERMEIRDRICLKRQRLLTITGMGGMGKTRLGKQVAAEVLDDFPDGVWMVECDSLDTREELLSGIAAVLGAQTSGSGLEESLAQKLADKKLLLFLDCFERVVEHAEILELLLKQCPNCQLLVTSRIVLGLPREFEYRLQPMVLKKRGIQPSDAVSLFAEAASHVLNSFEVTARNRPTVVELCELLEGVPLALVLAAGRLRHLSLAELLEQVKLNPLDVLRRRGSPKDKQADLYRVVASSFLLLDSRESGLLDRLSVFVGGFFADDAAEVCGWSKTALLNGLSTLRDHSLVQAQPQADRTRYKLLDTVREFLDQLPRDDEEADERRACMERHAGRYARLADDIGRLLADGRSSEGASLLWSEVGNLRASCKFASANSVPALLLRLSDSLCRPYFDMALYEDFERLSAAGLGAADHLQDLALQSRLLGLTGAYAAIRKDEAGWRSAWGRRLEICESMGDVVGSADALCDIAWESFSLGHVSDSHRDLLRAAEMARQVGDNALLARCYVERAQVEAKEGRLAAAAKLVVDATRAILDSENVHYGAYVNQHLVALNERLGHRDAALAAGVRMLNLGIRTHRHRSTAWALLKLAELHEAGGDVESAGLCLMSAVKLQAEFATRQGEKSRALFSQFAKRQREWVELAGQSYKRSSWRNLAGMLPYVQGQALQR